MNEEYVIKIVGDDGETINAEKVYSVSVNRSENAEINKLIEELKEEIKEKNIRLEALIKIAEEQNKIVDMANSAREIPNE